MTWNATGEGELPEQFAQTLVILRDVWEVLV
jgi:hypothetical protein